MIGAVDARLGELGIALPKPNAPAANYVPTILSGPYLYVSGQLPMQDGKLVSSGKLGDGVDIDGGREAARLCAIQVLAQAKAALGDLDRIVRIVKLVGFVASAPDFTEQPNVINGASDFFVEVLGDKGRHARSAVGVIALPRGASVELEAIIEVE